jgi:FkbM family methyltransferase
LIADTGPLFRRLLRSLEIETVCDVGSMDGADALRFRRVLPNAAVVALEPNPKNFALMTADERLRENGIRVLPLAASDRASTADFFLVDADYSPASRSGWRGMSSLHRRADKSVLADIVRVRTSRLDELLASESLDVAPIALWIDAEGMAFEVIAGAAGILTRTRLIHVEVETVPCIGTAQRLFPDVERVLCERGFVRLATDQPTTAPQFNALFIRTEHLRAKAAAIRWQVARGRLYRGVRRAVRPFVPLRLRQLLVRRLATAYGR